MFFFVPIGVDYQARRYPVITFTLMGICTVLFFATLPSTGSTKLFDDELPWVFQYLWLIPAESHWWSYFTSMFVHADFLHLLGNMIYLFLFGSCVEDLIGRWRYIVFYVLCGLASEFANIALSSDHFESVIPLGGASGAISGCIGGFLLLLPRTRIEFKWFYWIYYRAGVGEFFLPAWLVVTLWFVRDLAGLMARQLTREHGGIAFGAHLGGTLFGLAVIATRKLWLKPEQDEEEEEAGEAVRRPVARAWATAPAGAAAVETASLYLFINGSQAGPFTLSQVQQMFGVGSIPADALYWQEGMEDWRTADELRGPGVG